MAFNRSTGLKNKLLGRQGAGTGDGLSGILNLFVVKIYNGTRPANADMAPTGTLLGIYTVGNDGVTGGTWLAPSNGIMFRNTAENMLATQTAGQAGWGRICLLTDDDSLSTTLPRLDGTVGVGSGDIRLASLDFVDGYVDVLGNIKVS